MLVLVHKFTVCELKTTNICLKLIICVITILYILRYFTGGEVGKGVLPASGNLGVRNPSRDRLMSLKQVVTAPLPNARQ